MFDYNPILCYTAIIVGNTNVYINFMALIST